MYNEIDPAALTECIAPLPDAARRAICQYWEQVIREEWEPPVRPRPRAVPLSEDGRRARREAPRAVSRIATASRMPGSGVAA
jgi:glutathione S-transferase